MLMLKTAGCDLKRPPAVNPTLPHAGGVNSQVPVKLREVCDYPPSPPPQMHCSLLLKPISAFYSLQVLLSGPVAIETLWQAIARISRNGSPDTVHSAPVEEFHSPEETKGRLTLALPLCKSVSGPPSGQLCGEMRRWSSRTTKLFMGGTGNRRDLL